MAGADRLVTAMRKIGKAAVPSEDMTDIIFGLVVSLNPLIIEIENKFKLNADQLILSPLCNEKIIVTTIETSPHNILQSITLWEGLKNGDKVVMLRVNSGQTFYVMHKEGELI